MKEAFNKEFEKKIIPSKLKEARVARGLSMAELSERIGVTSQAISQYELGTSKPTSEKFMRIIDVLDFPSTFFYSINDSNSLVSNSAVYFRSNKSITKKLKEAYKIRFNWVDGLITFLERYIELPKCTLPNFNELYDEEFPSHNTIESIASHLRKHWNLGEEPIPNLVEILQMNGIIISRIEFGSKKLDAFSRWHNGKPYIILGTDKNSAVRSRFDLAHELGHLIMHKHISQDDLSNKEVLDRIEDEANYFASSFLLPLQTFNSEVMSSSINHFETLKKRWKVSISAMIRRCNDANILTDNQIRYLNSQMIRYGYYRREPLDDVIRVEKPYLFKQALNLLLDNKVVTKQKLLDIISLNSDEAETLFCLEPGFFKTGITPMKLRLVD